ncbi:MAG: hypothetical protein ACLUVC_08545 [Longibaculum sp.]
MNFIDIMIIIILGICVILAIYGVQRRGCHDCYNCHQKCGGKKNGKEFIENQRK